MAFSSSTSRKSGRLRFGRARSSEAPVKAGLYKWGWLPEVAVLSTLGLVLLALSNTAARSLAWWAQPTFWLSLLVITVPPTVRLLSAEASSFERVWLVGILGVELNLVKLLQSPIYLTYHDELLHWQTANDILNTHHLFQENSLLPVSPLYPGLELITNALNTLSGLPIFYCGVIVIGLARLLLVLAFYELYSKVGGSERVGGVAVLLYMNNPNFIFFHSQFAYESMALSFAAFTLCLLATRAWMPEQGRIGLNLAILLALGAVVVSHHLSSYALLGFLILWLACALLLGKRNELKVELGSTTLLLLVSIVAWLIFIANIVVGYLAPIFGQAVGEIMKLIGGEASSRQFFKDETGESSPVWEQLLGLGSTGLLLMGLPFGLLVIWQRLRKNALALTLALGALGYPGSLALRFTEAGADISSRASGFLFVATSFVIAVGFVHFRLMMLLELIPKWLKKFKLIPQLVTFSDKLLEMFRPLILLLWVVAMFGGGVIIGGGPAWSRQPGPFMVSADMRSIESQGVTTAYWASDYLEPGHRFVSDRINRLLFGTYGRQRPVTSLGDKLDLTVVVTDAELVNYDYQLLREGQVDYLVIDYRLSTALPRLGVYFEQGEPESNRHKRPLNPYALTKFDRLDKVSRIFDNGNIVIYDVRLLRNV